MPGLLYDLDYIKQPEYEGYADYNERNQAYIERRYIESTFQKVHGYNDPLVFNPQ